RRRQRIGSSGTSTAWSQSVGHDCGGRRVTADNRSRTRSNPKNAAPPAPDAARPARTPNTPCSHRPELAAMELTNTWAILTKWLTSAQFAGSLVPPPRVRHAVVGRRVPVRALKRANQPVRRPNAAATGSRQRHARGGFEGATLGRHERGAQLGN